MSEREQTATYDEDQVIEAIGHLQDNGMPMRAEAVRALLISAQSAAAPSATVGEEEIKRFRVGDILFSDEQAKMFCDLALKGLRAEAATVTADQLYALRKYPHDLRLSLPRYEEGWNDALEAAAKLCIPSETLPIAPSATASAFREVGTLHRLRNGEVHFIQKDDELEFPLHSTKTIYLKEGE